MGVVSYFPSLYEQPDFKTYTIWNEVDGQSQPVTGAYCSLVITRRSSFYTNESVVIGNVPQHVEINASYFNSPITFPPTITSLTNSMYNCSNFYSDIYIQSNQITNVANFIRSAKGANIYIRPEMETLFRSNGQYNSIKGRAITWINDAPNFCFYNTSYNLKVFYNYEG